MTPAPVRSRPPRTGAAHAPRVPRRVSGPVSRRLVAAPPAPAPGRTLPWREAAPPAPRRRLRAGALAEHRLVDRLLRSRLWIWALGLLLLGIVAMQVSLLKLNSGISRAVETTATLERQNGALETEIAALSSTDRVQAGAVQLGMVMPPAGDVGYLTAGPDDARRAVERMQPPSEDARALLENGGVVPGSLAATPLAPPAAGATAAPAGTTSAAPPATTSAPADGGPVAGQG